MNHGKHGWTSTNQEFQSGKSLKPSLPLLQKEELLKNKIMITVHPQYINDANGQRSLVILPVEEFDTMMEELEDIKLYDEAKKEDTGTRMLFSDYLKSRKQKNV